MSILEQDLTQVVCTFFQNLYFIALDYPMSVFPTTDYPTTKMPTTAKGQGTVYLCFALYRLYRAEAGVIILTSKIVNR